MSNIHNVCFVSRITLNSTVYYYCSAHRVNNLTLDGTDYLPYIQSVGDAEKIGNFGEGNQIGRCSMQLMFGQKQYQGPYNLSVTLPWNNGTCEIKICDVDTDTTWADCEAYYKGVIKGFQISADNISFSVEDSNQKDNVTLPLYTAEDIASSSVLLSSDDVPKDSVGKRIPMQFGYISDASNGLFAKGLLVSNKVGAQKIYFDNRNLNDLFDIGMWEHGMSRYFKGKSDGEYSISTDNTHISFVVDSVTTLSENLGATSGVETFLVSNYQNLAWADESDYEDIDSYPEILSVNIIAIDSELMLLVEQPTTNTVRVERGYGNTTVATHLSGATIYQCAKFSARNMLSFSEMFYPTAVSNFAYNVPLADYDILQGSGSFSGLISSDASEYLQLYNDLLYTEGRAINFDLRFEKVEADFTVYGAYFLMKAQAHINASLNVTTPTEFMLTIMSSGSTYNTLTTEFTGTVIGHMVLHIKVPSGRNELISVDTVSTERRTFLSGSYYQTSPNVFRDDEYTNTDAYLRGIFPRDAMPFGSLTSLNEKWKLNTWIYGCKPSSGYNYLSLYRVGFLVDFFASFVGRRVIGNLYGREVTSLTDSVFGITSTPSSVAVTPMEVLAYILIYDMGYAVADFDTASWRLTYGHEMIAYDAMPRVGLSYGIDESSKGWDLCQEIASQFGLMLTKTDAGKIKLISLFKLQDNDYYGYSFSMTHYQISIDDIIISGGRRQLSIQQTGTDRLRNVVRINYKRNNSTDEYQAVYPVVQSDLDSYTLTESGKTLSEARTTYYNGQKTETLVIDAFAVYLPADAERLAKWHLNDKAEVHFYFTADLPYYHYSDKNSKTSQYDIGDIVYLDGVYQGITFNSTHKFVIQEIIKTNQGRQVQISAKSIEPVSEF